MLRGIGSSRIVAGAYADRTSGGICPMLAAHRNGGRTSQASFARAWDRYTGARRPRLATRRELRTLTTLLEASLEHHPLAEPGSIAEAAARIRAERAATAGRSSPTEPLVPRPGERDRRTELRDRPHWAWTRPTRRYGDFRDLLAAAEEQFADQRAAELPGRRGTAHAGLGYTPS
jgi:hypothetical protein